MLNKLLLVATAVFSYGSNINLEKESVNEPYIVESSNNFQYFKDLFPDYTVSWVTNTMTVSAYLGYDEWLDLPNLSLDMFYFGSFHASHDIVNFNWSITGNNQSGSLSIEIPSQAEVPFALFQNSNVYNKTVFSTVFGVPLTYSLIFDFGNNMSYSHKVVAESNFRDNFALVNEEGIVEYINVVANDNYDRGNADGEATAEGGWLGNLVFGTIGGIVGFMFAIADFEVLGVSIMSIITLFVAIGVVILLIKVIK